MCKNNAVTNPTVAISPLNGKLNAQTPRSNEYRSSTSKIKLSHNVHKAVSTINIVVETDNIEIEFINSAMDEDISYTLHTVIHHSQNVKSFSYS